MRESWGAVHRREHGHKCRTGSEGVRQRQRGASIGADHQCSLLSDALSRVEWLESIVKTHLPGIDLTAGTPQSHPGETNLGIGQCSSTVEAATSACAKRRADEASLDDASTPGDHGKRMARDLGLVSLNVSNSRTHYLGASSGQFFVDLLQGDPDTPAQVAGENDSAESSDIEDASGSAGTKAARRGNSAVLKRLQKVCWTSIATESRTKTDGQILPTQDECLRHVKSFFHHYHPDYPVLHQGSVYSLVTALFSSFDVTSPEGLSQNGWPTDMAAFEYNGQRPNSETNKSDTISTNTAAALLLYILATAAHLQNHKHRFGSDPRPYEDLALQLMSSSLGDVSLESVQLIVLSILHGFISGKGGNPWVFLHLGMAYAIGLGLHRAAQDTSCFSREHMQIRRRVFFCLYTLDR